VIEFLVRHRATVLLVLLCIILFGSLTYRSLPREAAPDIKIPVVMIATPYIGVSPEDIESLITIPLENELSTLKDLKKMQSTSAEGASMISLEFEPEVEIEDVLQKVRDRVSRTKSKLPEDAEDPDVREISFSDFPIVIVTIAGPIDLEELKKLGETLQDDIESVSGVLEAKLSGGRTRQIRVQINPHRLRHYSLSMNDVISAVATENVNIPGGNVKTGSANYLLRVPGEFTTAKEIENVAVKRVGDRPVFIRDLGKVIDGFADRDSYSRMNRQQSVSIAVSKRSGANILEIVDQVKALAERHQKSWPKGVTFRALGDQSRFVRDIVSDLENNIITALLLVVGVILFFMGVRNSLFVAISIPLSMMLGMIVIWATGITLNMIVLFSLILALGMLVDNAIVLVENIYRHVEEGEDLITASIEGGKEVAGAVIASTLTTVAAFTPLLFWTGIMGQFMGYLPKTVVIVLMSSLLVAVGILPVLTARLMKKAKKRKKTPKETGPRTENVVLRVYRAVLGWSIDHRYVSAVAVTGVLVGTLFAYGKLSHGTQFMPDVQPDRAVVTVRAPDGTDIEATDAIVRQVEAIIASERNVDVSVAETGVAGGGTPVSGAQSATNQARITIDFLPHRTKAKPSDTPRYEDTNKTIERIRARVAKIPGAEFSVDKQKMGPPVGSPIAVEVSGGTFNEVGALAARMRRELATVKGVTDLRDNYRVGRPEMRLKINRGAAKRVGASTMAVATAVRTAVAGTKASTLRDGEDEYDIIVELLPQFKSDLQAITSLRIPGKEMTSPKTFSVPISAVASFGLAGGSGSIRRIDQDRVVTISGDVVDGFNENAVRAAVGSYIAKAKVPTGFKMRLGGANDEQRRAQSFLMKAFAVSVFLIAVVLVSQFNSFAIPFIIMGTVVLSLVGVLWGLIITSTPFGVIMTGLGVISLAGVVVNNAIVLLDYVQQLRAEDMAARDALVQAGVVRFRPVMLTAITTILGLVPMAAGISIDFTNARILLGSQNAAWWGPMAVAVIFGLAFATILTLVMVPTFYSIIEDFRGLPGRLWGHKKPPPEPVESSATG